MPALELWGTQERGLCHCSEPSRAHVPCPCLHGLWLHPSVRRWGRAVSCFFLEWELLGRLAVPLEAAVVRFAPEGLGDHRAPQLLSHVRRK